MIFEIRKPYASRENYVANINFRPETFVQRFYYSFHYGHYWPPLPPLLLRASITAELKCLLTEY